MPDINPKDLAAMNKKRNSRDLPPAFKDPNFKLRPDHKHRVSPVEKRNQLIGDAAKAVNAMNAKPKAKSKDEIKSAVKSTAPKRVKALPGAMRQYRATSGESLYSIAEKTVPNGKSVSSWFNAIKKMNAGKRVYRNTGVALPPGSSQYRQGYAVPPTKSKTNPNGR